MNWKKIPLWQVIFLMILLRVMTPSGYCKDIEIKSQAINQPIKLDGKLSDWPEGTTTFLGKPEATVGIVNDSEKIYVLIAFRKPEWARLIRMGGLTIWFDDQGKKHKNFMVRFIGGPSRDQIRELFGQDDNHMQQQDSSEYPERSGEAGKHFENRLICFQKDYLADKPIPLDGSQGPAAAYDIDNGFFAYEFSVPLKKSTAMSYGLGVPPTQKIGIGLIWGEFDREKMREGRPDMRSGFPPGGMGGEGDMPDGPRGMGGRRHGDRGGFPGGQGDGTPQKQEVWLKAQLTGPSINAN